MNRILVAYATMAGSTAEVSQAVAEEIGKSGFQVNVLPLSQVKDLQGYAGVVVGGPMIMGWHRAASGFLKKHRAALKSIPFAVFVMSMSLTQTGATSVDTIPLCIDPSLAKPPRNPQRLGLKERYARATNYVRPALQAAPQVRPVSIALFGALVPSSYQFFWYILSLQHIFWAYSLR